MAYDTNPFALGYSPTAEPMINGTGKDINQQPQQQKPGGSNQELINSLMKNRGTSNTPGTASGTTDTGLPTTAEPAGLPDPALAGVDSTMGAGAGVEGAGLPATAGVGGEAAALGGGEALGAGAAGLGEAGAGLGAAGAGVAEAAPAIGEGIAAAAPAIGEAFAGMSVADLLPLLLLA